MQIYIDLFVSWFKMGLFTFGGGYAMLPMIQKEVIEKHKWASEREIMDYYAVGQCTPGVIAVNTATFVGYKIIGILGGIVATLGVVSPSLLIISILTSLIANFSDLEIVQHALHGIQVAVCVLMFVAIEKLIKNGIQNMASFLLFVGAFILSYFTSVSTIWIVILAGICGYVIYQVKSRRVS
ncbi:MAG: chromate transporter [Solobacterium sp.]|nr:chromate transporter [Solobacterium sp.]